MRGADIKSEVWIDKSLLERGATLDNAHIFQRLTFDGSVSKDAITFEGCWFERDISMNDGMFDAIGFRRARVDGTLFLENAHIPGLAEMDGLRVDGNLFVRGKAEIATVNLRGARIGRQLGLENATVPGLLNMDSIEVGENLIMRDSKFQSVELREGSVARDVITDGSEFKGNLSLDGLDVKGSLRLTSATFEQISMKGTKVANALGMWGATVNSSLSAEELAVGNLVLGNGASFGDVNINAVKVAGVANLTDTHFRGLLIIENLQSSSTVLVRDSQFDGDVEIRLSKIDGSLTLSNANISSLNLSGTSIGGEINLAGLHWRKNSQIILRNTSVGAVADGQESWPNDLRVSLGGFVYQRWGGLNEPALPAANRPDEFPARWYFKALSRDAIYSKQPYEQLAGMLRATGYVEEAENVLFAENWRALFEGTASIFHKALQFLSMLFIGFGHRIYYALGWTIGFIILGAIVITHTPEGRANNIRYGLAYSFDILIPLIKLRELHYKIDFGGGRRPARYYFYFQKIMGFVLASFLIAGLSGLTK